jgi:hypothetical protein
MINNYRNCLLPGDEVEVLHMGRWMVTILEINGRYIRKNC